MNNNLHRCAITAALSLGSLLVTTLQAQDLREQQVVPTLSATRLDRVPLIDGDVLNDEAWTQVQPTSGFWQVRPNEGQPASQRTEVFMAYDEEALYIAVIAYDTNPAGIIVADSRRDSSLNETDSFQVILDGQLDRQNGFVFGTNPVGIEFDAQVTNEGSGGGFRGGGGGFNQNWDTSWEVDAQIGDFGWSAEMAIPFRSLRYGSGDVQTWGVNFQRNIRRNNEVAYWAPLERQFSLQRVSNAGTVTNIQPPRQRNLQVTPFALASFETGGNLPDDVSNEEFGFDMKWGVTSSLTLDATYNTDFAQVEVDDQQVNLDRFSLFFPEKRPFFLENAGLFSVGNPREAELFFSRRIGVGPGGNPIPINGGARLTGKVGSNTNVGLLAMSTDVEPGVAPQNNFTVARVSQELPNRSSIGGMVVQRDGDGAINDNPDADYNRTYALDGRWGIGDYTQIQGWAAQTDTPGLNGDDQAVGLRSNFSNQGWDLSAGYTEVQQNFNPEVGFLARQGGYRKYDWRIFRRYRPQNFYNLLEIRPHVNWFGFYDFDGFQQSGYLHVDSHWEWQNSSEIHTGVNFTQEGVKEPFEIVDGVTVPAGEYEHSESQLVYQTDQGAPLSFYIQSRIGGFFGGDRMALSPRVRYRIGEQFSTELSWNHSDIELPVPNGDFQVDVAQLRLSYSFTPRMSLQTLVQYNNQSDVIATNVRFAWLQSANAGLYLVYNEVDEMGLNLDDNGRQFILKYSHIIDIFN